MLHGLDRSSLDRDVLRLIPPDARLVLEFQTRTSPIAAWYREINPSGDYRIITPESIDGKFLDEVDLGTCDAIVFNHSLEVVSDPVSVLKRLVRLLRPEGQIIAAIANMAHWSILVNLIRGRWDDSPGGMVSKESIRFYTLASLPSLMEQSGLEIFEVEAQPALALDFDVFERLLTPAIDGLRVDRTQFREQAQTIRYLFRARIPGTPLSRVFIHSLIGEGIVCARPRIHEPHAFLRTIPGVRIVSSEGRAELGVALPGEDRIFIRQRTILDRRDLIAQKHLIDAGYLVIAEFDDDPDRFPNIALHEHLTFRACHAVQTSTESLAEALRPFNPNVAVFPNQITAVPDLPTDRPDSPLRIFFGALNREDDWRPLLPHFNQILGEFGNQVHVEVVFDELFYKSLRTESKTFEPLCSYARYCEILSRSHVALLPLGPGRFNERKSDLKFLECAAAGVVALASPTVYAATIQHGETGWIFQNPEEFATLLRRVLTDGASREQVIKRAHQYVGAHRRLANWYRTRFDWYRSLIERRDELNQQLLDRVPAIGQI